MGLKDTLNSLLMYRTPHNDPAPPATNRSCMQNLPGTARVPPGHRQERHLHCLLPVRRIVMNLHTHTSGKCVSESDRLVVREERESDGKNANTSPSRVLRHLDETANSDMTGQMH
jgi:hypothetical protein